MRVDLSGIRFAFPNECPCCGGMPDGTLVISASRSKGRRVVRTEVRAWNLPYCNRCIKHIKDVATIRLQLKLLAFVSIAVGALMAVTVSLLVGATTGVAALVGSLLVKKNQLDRLRS